MKKLYVFFWVLICTIAITGSAWGKVEVVRDKYGIPSIQADTEEELFEAFGYEVAVDRLWQMETHKRMAWGTFAEIFGPKLVPMDSMTRMMAYTEDEYVEIFKKIPGDYQKLFSAYISGINRRVDEVLADPRLLPMEYLALKLKPGHFREIDSLSFLSALYRIFGIRGGGELKNLSALQTLTKRFGMRDGWAIFNDLYWINDPAAPTYTDQKIQGDHIPGVTFSSVSPSYLKGTGNVRKMALKAEAQYTGALDEASRVGAPVKSGSYSWTLSPEVTGTGYPILVGQVQALHGGVPSIVHEIQLKGGRFNVVGASVPLLPFILAGHNHHLAWSIMVGMVDNVDIYQEILNPNDKSEYLFRGSWRKMDRRIEKITIAGGQVKEITVYRTVHGPVFSPFPFDPMSFEGDRVYTKKISWWQTESMFAEGLFRIDVSRNHLEFGQAMALHTPAVHYTYADIRGNIGYWHNGLNPERPDGFDPRLPLPGTGEAEWTGKTLPNAHVLNPSKGYVNGWNNKASPDTRNPFDTDPNNQFGPYHRCLWLERAIGGRNDLDLPANEKIMRFIGGAGVYSSNDLNSVGYACKLLLPFIARAVNGAGEDEKPIFEKVLAVFGNWDGRSVDDPINDELFQAGQTIFLDWLPRLIKATFGDELEGIENFKTVHNQTLGLLLRCVGGPVTTLPVSRNYFDNITTSREETMEELFLQTLGETVAHLKETFKSDDPVEWKAPRARIVYKHNMFGKLAEMWDNNIGTYIIIVELRPEGAVGRSRFHLGESGNIAAGPNGKPVFDPHFFDMQPLFQSYTHQKMGLD